MAWLPLQEGGRGVERLPAPGMEMAPPSSHVQCSCQEITETAHFAIHKACFEHDAPTAAGFRSPSPALCLFSRVFSRKSNYSTSSCWATNTQGESTLQHLMHGLFPPCGKLSTEIHQNSGHLYSVQVFYRDMHSGNEVNL